jgi:hypothetical protein
MPISKVGSKGIKDAELSAADIAPGTITSDKIASGTIANAKLANSSITVNGTAIALGASGDIVAGTDWQSVKTSDFTAVAGEGYFVNTTGGAITLTLPASPTIGDTIQVRDYAETFGSNNVTLSRNSSNIGGIAANGTLSTSKTMTTLVYVDGTKGWLATENEAKDNVVPSLYTSATGGTVSTSGNYKIHTFNSSSNFVVSQVGNGSVVPTGGPAVSDYLVVAGGGGGGSGYGAGGGGAGGFRESKSPVAGTYTASPLASSTGLTITAQTYPITVGAGGGGGPVGKRGVSGSNSIFSTITSAGGGYGGAYYDPGGSPYSGAGGDGGSGGGEGVSVGGPVASGNTPPVSPPQGQNGGINTNSGNHHASGGGGAGAVGGNGRNDGCNQPTNANGYGGNGGDGVSTAIKGSSGNYAGGGGGGRETNCAPHQGSGGSGGGGGAGLNSTAGSNGGANQGGGGGGQGGTAAIPSGYGSGGGSGGAGVVIIRYKYQ